MALGWSEELFVDGREEDRLQLAGWPQWTQSQRLWLAGGRVVPTGFLRKPAPSPL